MYWGSYLEVFCKSGVRSNLQENTCTGVSFLNLIKLQASTL